MDENHKLEMYHILAGKIASHAFDGKKVIVFGHCNATERMIDYLFEQGINPEIILDNNLAKQGLSYHNIPILSPNSIQRYSNQDSIVLIATRFFPEMSSQLIRLGYAGEIVQIGKFTSYNSFTEYSLSEETLEGRLTRIKKGVRILEKIRFQYLKHHLVICPNKAFGDVYWACAFLPAYCKKNNISMKNVVIIVIGESCAQVAELFKMKNIVILSNSEMDGIVQTVVFTQEQNCIIAHQDLPYTDNIIKWINKHFLSFIDYYRFAIYGLDKSIAPILPHEFVPFENREQIPKDKSVIMSPYAKSVVNLSTQYWEEIAADYNKQGFHVYTNTANSEQPIKGTVSINIPISQMPSAVEHAGTFVGIRSGICDVIYNANCRKVVVFPDCYYSTTPHKVAEFFALPNWEVIK